MRKKIAVCYCTILGEATVVLFVFYIRYNLSVKFTYRKSEQKTSRRYRVTEFVLRKDSKATSRLWFSSLSTCIFWADQIQYLSCRSQKSARLRFFLHECKLLELISSYTDFTAIEQQNCAIFSDFFFKVTGIPDYSFIFDNMIRYFVDYIRNL